MKSFITQIMRFYGESREQLARSFMVVRDEAGVRVSAHGPGFVWFGFPISAKEAAPRPNQLVQM